MSRRIVPSSLLTLSILDNSLAFASRGNERTKEHDCGTAIPSFDQFRFSRLRLRSLPSRPTGALITIRSSVDDPGAKVVVGLKTPRSEQSGRRLA